MLSWIRISFFILHLPEYPFSSPQFIKFYAWLMVFRFFFLLTCLHAPMTNNDESLPFMNMNAVSFLHAGSFKWAWSGHKKLNVYGGGVKFVRILFLYGRIVLWQRLHAVISPKLGWGLSQVDGLLKVCDIRGELGYRWTYPKVEELGN